MARLYPGEKSPVIPSQPIKEGLNIATIIKKYPKVKVGMTSYGQRGLFTAVDIAEGEEIMREPAFFWEVNVPVEDTVAGSGEGHLPTCYFSDDKVEDSDAKLYQMAPYHGETAEVSATRAEFASKALAANSFNCAATIDLPSGDLAVAEGRALFLIICLSNHSCGPNARIQQDDPPSALGMAPEYVMEARHAIPAGSEITVSYIPRIWRKAKRLTELQAVWGFSCNCPRCTTDVDDTMVARCPACKDGQVFHGAVLRCTACGDTFTDTSTISYSTPEGPASLPLRSMADDELMLNLAFPVSAAGDLPPPARLLQLITEHPILRLEDSRMWTALNQVFNMIDASENPSLHEEALAHLATTACVTPYINLSDLGIQIE